MNTSPNMAFKNGDFFEEMFLTKMQEHVSVISGDNTDHQFYSDIIDEDCLIEIKSHRDWSKSQTTVEVLRTIVQRSINDQQKTGIPKGLFAQIHNLFGQVINKNKKAMVIAGVYTEEVNKLYNTWRNQADRAFANYKYYDILVFDQYFSALCRISKEDFWLLVKNSSNLTDLHQHLCYETIEITNECQSLCNVRSKNDPEFALWEVFKGNVVKKRGQKYTLQQIVDSGQSWSLENNQLWGQGVDESQKSESWGSPNNELWGQNIIDTQQDHSDTHEDEIKVDYQEGFAFNESTKDCFTYPEQAQIESVEQIAELPFSDKLLILIKSSIENHDSFEVISNKLGKSNQYLYGCLRPENNSGLKWDNFRNWIKPILIANEHVETPVNWCTDSLKDKILDKKNRDIHGLKTINGKQKKQLEQLEQELEKMKSMSNNNENTQSKSKNDLHIEALKAEIEKQKKQLEALTLEKENLATELEIEKECKASLSSDIHDVVASDIQRYIRIIDSLLELNEMKGFE